MAQPQIIRSRFGDDPTIPTQDYGNIRPKFYMQPVIDPNRSKETGKAVYAEMEVIEYLIPGDLKSAPVMQVTDRHRELWPKEYEAFKKGEEYQLEGMPLDKWGLLRPAQAMTLKAQGFETVEQFAEARDNVLDGLFMGARAMRDKARAFVSSLAGEEQAKKIEDMQAQLDTLMKLLDERTKGDVDPINATPDVPEKRGPGRPRKAETDASL